ncbi:cellulose synthase subunit C [Komagataeibacter europaeus NBRC 3261]|uniref:Cellulose synthase subunit C n=1 Tax=Komagataeibacter europaeus NBRC 3261 TaxID=1234669 RepID=A0A0D6PZ83_KOMEU|nr:cellulose synthase subunit C [Komagataeibacter europaeus NBRC 3261]
MIMSRRYVFLLSAGRLSAAEQSFQSALQINSHDADSLGGMGLVSMRQGDAAEARRYFQEAMAADPKTADRWRPALAGMEISGDYAAVRQMIAAHQYTEAKQRLTSLARQPGQFTGATLMLADLQRTTGQIDASEQSYRSVLARDPNSPLALMGLARVDMAQGNTAEARQLLSRVGPQYAEQVGEIEVTGLMAAASHTSDSARKVSILREAMTQAPRDPWVRINLANALQQQGDVAEAGRVMQPILANPVTAQDRQAGILYTYGAGNDAATRRLLSGLSPEDYSPAIRSIATEMEIKEDLASRLSMVANPVPLIREALSPPDPTGARGVAVADLFRQRGDMLHARMALRIASTRTIDLSPDQRLAYATEYMKISNPVAAARLLAPLGDGSGSGMGNALPPEQQQTLQQLRMGISVAQSDLLNQRGDQAQAYDQLAPALRADPEATAPKLALARLADRTFGTHLASEWRGEWGGVVTNHFHGQVEATLGNTIVYGGGGYAIQTGKNVRRNSEREAGIGVNTLVWHNANMLVRIGVSLTYFGYGNNQDFYTYGQGGYFSPQSYYAATVPIRYAGQHKRLDWDVNASVGYQVFHEHSSPFFPTSSLLQSGAQYVANNYVTNATSSDYLSQETVNSAYYPGDSVASLTGGFNARVGYRFTHNLRLDLSGRWQKAGNWTESGAMISAHYLIMDQ